MEYRFDWKAFLLVTGVVLTSGIGLYAAHRFQQPRNARSLLSRVDRAEEESHLNEAVRFLDRYLTLNPNDAVEWYRYADLLERVAGDKPNRFLAIEAYEKVLKQNPERLDARRRVAILMTEARRWKDAIEHLQILRNESPTDDKIETLLGQCFAFRGNSEAVHGDWGAAAVSFDKACALRGAEPATFARLAECYHRLKLEKKAEEKLEEMIRSERFKGDFRAYLVRANYLSQHKEASFKLTEKAFADLKAEKAFTDLKNNKVSDTVIKGLKAFQDQEFSLRDFEKKIVAILNGNEIASGEKKQLQSTILRHADLAFQDLKTAKALAPKDHHDVIDVILGMASTATKRGEQKEAQAELENGLTAHPKEPKLCLALAEWELANGHSEDALARLKRGVIDSPDHADLVVTLIHQLIGTGDLQAAGTMLAAATANKNLHLDLNDADLLRARLEVATGNWSGVLLRLEALQGRVLPESPKAALIYLLQSRIAARVGDLDKHIQLLEKSLAITSTPAARLEYAMALVEAGKTNSAIVEFQRLENALPPSACLALVRLETAKTLTMSEANRNWAKVDHLLDGAKQASPRILGMVIPSVAWFLADADVHAAKGQGKSEAAKEQAKRAREILDWLCQVCPENPAPWIARSDLVSRTEKPDAAQEILVEAAKIPKLNSLMSIFLASQKPRDQAIRDAKLATERLDALSSEEMAPAWGLAATLYLHLEVYDLARDAAARVVALRPDNLQNQLLLFEAAAQYGDSGSMEKAIEAIGRLEGPRGGMVSYCGASRLILSLSRFNLTDQALVALQAAKVPELLLAKLNNLKNKELFRDDFVGEIKKVLNAEETKQFQVILKHAAVPRAIEANEKDKSEMLSTARALLTVADEHRPGWPKVPLLWAQWYTLKGDHENAAVNYRRAFDQGERSFEMVRALIRVYIAHGKFKEVQAVIERLDKETTSPTAQRMFTETYLQIPNFSRALDAALKAHLEKSEDATDHMILGLLHAAAMNLPDAVKKAEAEEKAKKEFARACELAKTPEPWVFRVQFLLANKGKENAEAIFNGEDFVKFSKKVPDLLVKLTIAKCAEILNPGAKADSAYEAVLLAAPSNREYIHAVAEYYLRTGRLDLAERLFRKLINNESLGGTLDEVRENRRQYAITLAEGGDFLQCGEALKLIDQNVKEVGENRPDALARAAILAKQPGGKVKAMRLYATLDLYDQPLPAEARYVYAQLYFITGDVDRGREQIKLAIDTSKENPTYVAYGANVLIAEKNLSAAQQLVQKLVNADPNRWLVVELQAQLDHARGKTNEAVQRIIKDFPTNDTEALAAARRLEEYKDVKTAKEKLNALAKKKDSSPFAALAYAAFLTRQKEVENALALCDTLIDKSPRELPAPVVAGMTLEFLGYGQSKDKYEHVERWLKNADARDDRPTAFMRADALDRKGDYQGAKRAYEDLLEKESKNPLVLFPLARLVLLPQGASVTDAKRAEHLLTDAMKVSGPRSHLMELRAAAKLRQGRFEECIKDLRATLAEQPTATGYLLLSVALRRFRDNFGADAALEEYIRRDSTLFKLTEKALEDLGTQKVPEPVLVNMRPLINKVFPRKAFELIITKAFGDAKTNLTPDFRGLILDSADFNVSSLHPLEATEYRSLRNEAYRGSP